jgi:hypothetical protein
MERPFLLQLFKKGPKFTRIKYFQYHNPQDGERFLLKLSKFNVKMRIRPNFAWTMIMGLIYILTECSVIAKNFQLNGKIKEYFILYLFVQRRGWQFKNIAIKFLSSESTGMF